MLQDGNSVRPFPAVYHSVGRDTRDCGAIGCADGKAVVSRLASALQNSQSIETLLPPFLPKTVPVADHPLCVCGRRGFDP